MGGSKRPQKAHRGTAIVSMLCPQIFLKIVQNWPETSAGQRQRFGRKLAKSKSHYFRSERFSAPPSLAPTRRDTILLLARSWLAAAMTGNTSWASLSKAARVPARSIRHCVCSCRRDRGSSIEVQDQDQRRITRLGETAAL